MRQPPMQRLLLTLCWALLLQLGFGDEEASRKDGESRLSSSSSLYGVDVSFPIHHHRVSTNYIDMPHNLDPSLPVPLQQKDQPLQPLGMRHKAYLRYLDGCRHSIANTEYTGRCDLFEYDRQLMNRRQPQSMVNYTETGFQKVKAPEHLTELVSAFWQKNHLAPQKNETWGVGNSYANVWDRPTRVVSVDDVGLRGSGAKLKEEIWSALSALMEEWTQQELQPSSLYGIRVYEEGAVMMPQYVLLQ